MPLKLVHTPVEAATVEGGGCASMRAWEHFAGPGRGEAGERTTLENRLRV
jgi:hypothetical protein